MTLAAGTQLGSYHVVALLGEGGMGQVYRAHDTKLGRDVALKLLPETFTHDAERVARFRREAQVLASLNHPHIGAIYGLDDSGAQQFLVLELIDGESLDQRIARGPIPIDDAIAIARQIADALEAAHDKGIVHRDLKPANIAVAADGTVKVLDFGLAKPAAPATAMSSATMSPTITTPAAMTGVGVILGTAAYMAPEQAKGRAADKRADVWAFGCVLFEMLCGRRAFDGDDVGEVLASVIKSAPEWPALPADTPAPVRALLDGCLKKDPRQRIGDLSTVRFVLDTPIATAAAPPGSARSRRVLPLVALASALLGAVVSGAIVWSTRSATRSPVVRFTIPVPENRSLALVGRAILALSPDGERLAFVTQGGVLYMRALNDANSQRIAVSTQGVRPFFSSDGQWLAFGSSDQTLKKIAVTGGAPTTICRLAQAPIGASWVGDSIVVTQSNGIMRVAASGGEPELIVPLHEAEQINSVQLIDGGRSVLFSVAEGQAVDRWDRANIVMQRIGSTERIVVVRGGVEPRYVEPGHLVYAVGSTLFAVRFDQRSGRTTGGPVPILEGVMRSTGTNNGVAQFTISENGTLAYLPGIGSANQQLFVRIDRSGAFQRLDLPISAFNRPRVSPDGTRLLYGIDDGVDAALWMYDLRGGTPARRLTFAGRSVNPMWSRDGRWIVYEAEADGQRGLFRQPADGSATPERLTTAERGATHTAESWTPDGHTLLFTAAAERKPQAIWSVAVDGDRQPRPLLVGPRIFANAAVSPDGRWLAYNSNEINGAAHNVFVQPYPPNGAKRQVSSGLSANSAWTADGRQLIFDAGPGSNQLVAVDVRAEGGSLSFGPPVAITVPGIGNITPLNRQYDVLPDGSGFIAVVPPNAVDGRGVRPPEIAVVLNWFEELNQRMPR